MRLLSPLLVLFFFSCQELIDAPVPEQRWAAFDAPGNKPLTTEERTALEGVFTTVESADNFGDEAALKWAYTVNGNDTTWSFSFFCSEDVRYFICQGKKNDTAILLNGYWRNVQNTKTGKAHFTIPLADITNEGAAFEQRASLRINGVYGRGDDEPEKPIAFQYSRPLNKSDYLVIAHRGGGRNNDLLPGSENSVELLKLSAVLGANGVEVDVQVTKDSVPILYHDDRINDRLTDKTAIQGPITDYSFAELERDVKLKRGGKIPTLKQALDSTLYKTPLEFFWIDCKYPSGVSTILALQKEYTAKAKAAGRKFEIVFGVPSEDVMGRLMTLTNDQSPLLLSELDTALTLKMKADIWATAWIKGAKQEQSAAMQAKGKRTLFWTIDPSLQIEKVISEYNFNGICTNRPTLAAYYRYAKQAKSEE